MGTSFSGANPVSLARSRTGPEIHQSQADFRKQVTAETVSALGLPAEFLAPGPGAASREAFRRWVLAGIEPLARAAEAELSLKLEVPISFTFRELGAADLRGRGTALTSLVNAGVAVEDARKVVGL